MRPNSPRLFHRFCSLMFLIQPLILGALAAEGSSLSAQTSTTPTIYRLHKTSSFRRGCFAPCLCPVMESGSERGTFTLSFVGYDGFFSVYWIRDVNWIVSPPSGEIQITGSGTYRVGGEFAIQQRLEMDLQVGTNPADHFDSGLIAGGGEFPRINLTISIHGQYCFDTVFGVDASPVPDQEITHYLLQPGSSFQRGCFDMCDCAIGPLLPLRGGFALVPLQRNPLFTEYSVVNVDWSVGADPTPVSSSEVPITGFGDYRVGGEFAVQQQKTATLKVGTESPALFDSGLVAGGGSFPTIDIAIINEANSCVRTTLDLHAKPIKPRFLALPAAGVRVGVPAPGI